LNYFKIDSSAVSESLAVEIRNLRLSNETFAAKFDARLSNLALETNLIKNKLPDVIAGIELTPSSVTSTKNSRYTDFLEGLNIKPPKISNNALYDVELNENYIRFDWNWRGKEEHDSYGPLCQTLSSYGLHAVNVADGQYLFDKLLFTQHVWSIRKFDANGKLIQPVIHKGRVSGRVDIVVLYDPFDMEPDSKLLRNMVRFAFEIKTHKYLSEKREGCVREAVIQVIGLCADNQNNSPCVILTDLTAQFYVVYLHKIDNPLNFDIQVQPCSNLHSAITLASDKSKECISFNFGRPPTPPSSYFREEAEAEVGDSASNDNLDLLDEKAAETVFVQREEENWDNGRKR